METTLVSIDVDETFIPHNPSARNPISICINLVNRIQRLAINESSETKTCFTHPSASSFSQINLNLHYYEFSPSYLSSLIDPHLSSPHKSDLIAEEMAYWAIQRMFIKRQPYRMFVNVVSTKNVLVTDQKESQKEEEEEEEESTCAICLEEMVKDETMEVMFSCSHRFHLRCIAEWLQNSDSCPLCRQNLFGVE